VEFGLAAIESAPGTEVTLKDDSFDGQDSFFARTAG
jgi:hypothetical protein